jgi:hypothetical protein
MIVFNDLHGLAEIATQAAPAVALLQDKPEWNLIKRWCQKGVQFCRSQVIDSSTSDLTDFVVPEMNVSDINPDHT